MNELLKKAIQYGIIPRDGTVGMLDERAKRQLVARMAMDAAPVTSANNAIPQYLLNLMNPEVIRVLLAPMKAEKIFGTVKKGSLHTKTTTFIQSEIGGAVDTYGDVSHGGSVDVNHNFPGFDSYAFETTMTVGDVEAAEWSEAKINLLSEKELAAADTIKRTHNKIWFFGVNGLRNYGLTNNPNLPATINPDPDPSVTGNPTMWETAKSALGVFNDVKKLRGALQRQSRGHIPDDAQLKLVISTNRAESLLKTNEFGITVIDRLKKAFPNLEVIDVPEYSTPAGEMAQLIAVSVEGHKTGEIGYTELMRSHGIVRGLSATQEKKSAGNWGSIIYHPFAIATMIGI